MNEQEYNEVKNEAAALEWVGSLLLHLRVVVFGTFMQYGLTFE